MTFPRTPGALPLLALLATGAAAVSGAEADVKGEEAMTEAAKRDGAHDFDFLMGRWTVRNRRLKERLKGSTEWIEFEATNVAHRLPAGLGNEDEFRTEWNGGFVGTTFRFYDPKSRKWSLYWADSRRGVLDPPVVGGFAGDTGIFEGDDTWEGKPIRVRFTWSRADSEAPRWEQAFSTDGGRSWETNWVMEFARATDSVAHLQDLQVLELRRYTLKPGTRERFARCFERWFPEAFQQLGAVAVGQFFERDRPERFTWIRGFRSMEARATSLASFYYGPVWKEHAQTMNDMIVDSDDVLLLRPLAPDRGLPVFPGVDPTAGDVSRGIVVAQIFPSHGGRIDDLAREAEPLFARYRAAGAREAGVLATLDAKNNFPQHPVRTDGPYLVWIGTVPTEEALDTRLRPLAASAAAALVNSTALRGAPEFVVLAPTERSRLRWVPVGQR